MTSFSWHLIQHCWTMCCTAHALAVETWSKGLPSAANSSATASSFWTASAASLENATTSCNRAGQNRKVPWTQRNQPVLTCHAIEQEPIGKVVPQIQARLSSCEVTQKPQKAQRPQKVVLAFDTGWWLSGSDTTGHGFKSQW